MSELPPSPFAPPRTENLLARDGAGGGEVSHGAIEALRRTRPWVILFAVLSFLGSGLMVLLGIMVAVMGSIPGAAAEQPFGRFGWALGLFYLAFGAAYVYPGVRLLQYGLAIGRLVQGRRPADLEQALELQMRFWRFIGILTLALIALYFVVLVVLVGAAATGAMSS
jgi:hypothetical protein